MPSPVVGWLWPAWWQEDQPDPSPLEMARELARLDAENLEHYDELFNGLLDLPEPQVVQWYYSRL